MRVTEQIRLAWHTMRWSSRWITVLLAVMASVCLFFGINIQQEVAAEKSAPCELTVTLLPGTLSQSINGEVFGQVQQIEEVLAVTHVWTWSTSLHVEEYGAELTLCGIDASYLAGVWLQGNEFPEDSAMPYLVLNEAAIRSMKDEKQIPMENAAALDWTTKQATLLGEGETVVRICGILQDGQELPMAYLSQDQVKKLRMEAGQESPANTLWLRLKDSGVCESVVKAISSLGLQAESENTREADWKMRMERVYLYGGTGWILLMCSVIVNACWEKIWRKEEAQTYRTLDQMGIPKKMMRSIAFWRWIWIYAIGGMAGGIILFFL